MLSGATVTVSKPLAEYYGNNYYAHSCGSSPYRRDEPAWVAFFGRIADQLVAELAPRSVLDAGCALGLLVEALRDRGVEAWGLDFSPYAIDQVRADIRPFCWVGSITRDLNRDYDLITCIEVLEHLPADDADVAIGNLTSHTDQMLFSSTSDDYREPTHLNVQPPDYWAGLFARHGFYRDVDFEAPYVAPHAVLFRRQHGAPIATIRAYERRCAQLARENRELRAAQLAAPEGVQESLPRVAPADPEAASETERRLLAAIVGAGRMIAPPGTPRRRVLRHVVGRFVDALDRVYVRVRRRGVGRAPMPEASSAGAGAVTSGPAGKVDGPELSAPARVMALLWAGPSIGQARPALE